MASYVCLVMMISLAALAQCVGDSAGPANRGRGFERKQGSLRRDNGLLDLGEFGLGVRLASFHGELRLSELLLQVDWHVIQMNLERADL